VQKKKKQKKKKEKKKSERCKCASDCVDVDKC